MPVFKTTQTFLKLTPAKTSKNKQSAMHITSCHVMSSFFILAAVHHCPKSVAVLKCKSLRELFSTLDLPYTSERHNTVMRSSDTETQAAFPSDSTINLPATRRENTLAITHVNYNNNNDDCH
jgi:hypothetical protein